MGIDTKKKGVLLDITENYASSALEKVIFEEITQKSTFDAKTRGSLFLG